MKKTWNKLIIVSFIVLAVVACAAIVFLYPYYNEYKVFDGIEAGQWSEVQKSYEALDSEKKKAVQEMLPDYAKHICLEYQTGEKDYIYTVAAYDAINSIDETKSICTKYNVLVNRTEYRDAIEQIYNSNQNYNGQGVVQANETINKINLRLDTDTKKEVVIEVLNEKYQQYVDGEITADAMNSYISIVNGLAVTDIAEYIRNNPIPKKRGADEIKQYFVSLVFAVNRHIYSIAQKSAPEGMATTLVILMLDGEKAYVINVGDSRLYLIRDDNIMQVTEDHTYVNGLLKKGIIDEEQARNHPDRNMITRAVGAEQNVEPDLFLFDVYSGDIILMCTDGLYNELSDDEMHKIITDSSDMRSACSKLVDEANERGGSDNITAVSVRI